MLAGVSAAPTELLEQVFGHKGFRRGQARAVEALLDGRDVVALMPTGGGKSLCYQLPAVAVRAEGRGLTVVISPLIALMNDQVDGLKARGVKAAALHSAQDELEQREVVAHLMTHKLDLLYVSPERAALPGFRRLLARTQVSHLAIDEAHCISQWGHDFRPEYARLGELRALLDVPTMALTATATRRVLDEIASSLGLKEPVQVHGTFARPNLRFSVRHIGKDAERLKALIETLEAAKMREPGTGRAIVYCATRKKVETVAKTLKTQGFAARHYHAGRTDRARGQAHRAFDLGRARVLVATNAFGMGVDHPDVRLIVHFQTPGSVEAYYQEAGRAGRDGLPADCVLFFGVGDLVTQRYLNRKSATCATQVSRRERLLNGVETYAHSLSCRQQFVANYFLGASSSHQRDEDTGGRDTNQQGEDTPCGVCDVCRDREGTARHLEQAATAATPKKSLCTPLADADLDTVVDAVAKLRRPVGKGSLARALRGSRAKPLKRLGLLDLAEHGVLSLHTEVCISDGIELLIRERRVERRGVKYPTVWLAGRRVRASGKDTTKRPERPTRHSVLQRALERYRQQQARALRWKRYKVFTNAVIKQIDEQQPDSLWTLEQIRGLGPAKIERFGHDLLDLVRRYRL